MGLLQMKRKDNSKLSIRKSIHKDVIYFNKKYRKGNSFLIIFDFLYLSFKFILREFLGKQRKDKIIARLRTERIFTTSYLPDGNKIIHRLEHKGVINEVYSEGSYDAAINIKKGIIIDLGSNIGLFSLKMSKIIGENGKIYALEPSKDSYNILEKNIKLNKSNIIAFNEAVSNKNAKIKFFLHNLSVSDSTFVKSDKFYYVNAITLNNLIKREKIKKIDLMKMDIEGSEYEVIKNSKNILKKTKSLVLELHNEFLNEKQIKEIKKILKDCGFKNKVLSWPRPLVIYYYR